MGAELLDFGNRELPVIESQIVDHPFEGSALLLVSNLQRSGGADRPAEAVGDNLGFLRVWDARLEHTDDCASAIAPDAAKLNGPANNRRIFPERVRPETIGEDNDAGSVGTVIFRSNQASEHGTQSHHLEIGSVDHAAINFARLA